MQRDIIWTEPAKDDLREIYWYIANDSTAAADRVIDRLYERPNQLLTQPLSGRVVPEKANEFYRELIEGSYRILYCLDDVAIYILRVSHHARLLKL